MLVSLDTTMVAKFSESFRVTLSALGGRLGCRVRPGREHDTTALREHGEILPPFTARTDDHLQVFVDLGYEDEAATITVAFKKPKNRTCTDVQQQFNRAHNAVRAIGERGNSLLKTTAAAFIPADVQSRLASIGRPGHGRVR
jgi:hypothetical protein